MLLIVMMALLFTVLFGLCSRAYACTGFVAGKKATADGSLIYPYENTKLEFYEIQDAEMAASVVDDAVFRNSSELLLHSQAWHECVIASAALHNTGIFCFPVFS